MSELYQPLSGAYLLPGRPMPLGGSRPLTPQELAKIQSNLDKVSNLPKHESGTHNFFIALEPNPPTSSFIYSENLQNNHQRDLLSSIQ